MAHHYDEGSNLMDPQSNKRLQEESAFNNQTAQGGKVYDRLSGNSSFSGLVHDSSGSQPTEALAATALDGTPAVAFTSGAKRSKVMPRFDLIPYEALQCLADRFELGTKKYSKDNWKKGANDPNFNTDALNHMQHHLSCLINEDFSEDDAWGHLGAIIWGAATRAWKIKQDEKVK